MLREPRPPSGVPGGTALRGPLLARELLSPLSPLRPGIPGSYRHGMLSPKLPALPPLYQCSGAAVTKCHKLGDFKRREFIASRFWRPESKIKVSLKPVRASPPRHLPASGGGWQSLVSSACRCFTPASASRFPRPSPSASVHVSCFFKDTCYRLALIQRDLI